MAPLSQSNLRPRLVDSNLGHPDLVRLVDSLGPGLRSLSDNVFDFVKENRRLYATKELLENNEYTGEVFVDAGTALIDVQDFIALSSFIHAAERLMKTNLYTTHIHTRDRAQQSAQDEIDPTLAMVMPSNVDSGVDRLATQTHPTKIREGRHAAKRLKIAHSLQDLERPESPSSFGAPLTETTFPPAKDSHCHVQQLPPSTGVSIISTLSVDHEASTRIHPRSSGSLSDSQKNQTVSDLSNATNEIALPQAQISHAFEAKDRPPTKKIRLESTIVITGDTESKSTVNSRADTVDALNDDNPSARSPTPRKLRNRKSLKRL